MALAARPVELPRRCGQAGADAAITLALPAANLAIGRAAAAQRGLSRQPAHTAHLAGGKEGRSVVIRL